MARRCIAIKRGNAASLLGTFPVDGDAEEYFDALYYSFFLLLLLRFFFYYFKIANINSAGFFFA